MIQIKTFLVVDGHSLAHRGYSALSARLTAPDGTPTAMIVGFMNMLYRVQDDLMPDCTIAIFDARGKTFRHEIYAGYKAGRKPIDDDLRVQLPILQELLSLCGIRVIIREGVEADDSVASAVKLIRRGGNEAVILTSDKDMFQLLGDGVKIIRTTKFGVTGAKIYDEAAFVKEYGFHPASFPDYLAMLGDSIDNIKGVHGVGDITAKKILAKFPTLEAVYASLDTLPKSARAKFEAAGRDSVIWTRDNLIILRDNIFDDDPDFLNDCMNYGENFEAAESLALRLGLTRVLERIGSKKKPLPREFYRKGDFPPPESDIITCDYKNELRASPAKFQDAPRVWDLKTAYYLLHPDSASWNFPDIAQSVNASTNPAGTLSELAGSIDAEISKYDGLHDVMTELDLPLIPVLNRMEDHGIRIAPEKFDSLYEDLSARVAEIESEVIRSTGFRINLNSPAQISWLLFEQLKFPPSKKNKSKSAYTTDAGVLEKLASEPGGEIPGLILEHREINKMLTGFVIPLQKAADKDGIIHTTFEPAMTGTGRLSSRDPNLQNIPTFGKWADKIKAGLIPVNPENVFVSADYSQLELRVLAHMSGEERLITAFAEGRDIHTETASWVFDTAPDFVTPEMRRAAKMINFGLIYGMSSFGLSERLGVKRAEADGIMSRYFDAIPGIADFLINLVIDARERGYSRTLAGRIRPVAEIPAKAQALDRALVNSPIQGTAADTARRAMIRFAESGTAEMLLQVHDSIVCECSPDMAGEVAQSLREIMIESGGEISHLEAETKQGATLADV